MFLDIWASPVYLDDSEEEWLPCETFLFVWKVCVTGAICVFGIIGNLLSLWLIHKSKSLKLAAPMILLLSALEVADILYVFLYSLVQVLPDLFYHCCGAERIQTTVMYFYSYLWPVAMIALSCGNWFTVLISVHRLYAVFHPLKVKELSSMKRVSLNVICCTCSCILVDLPRFFEIHVIDVVDPVTNETSKGREYNDFFSNEYYQLIYKTILNPTYKFYIPMCIVTVLSIRIIQELKRANKRRQHMLSRSRAKYDSDTQVTKTMLWIIITWIVLATPTVIYPIIRNFLSDVSIVNPCIPYNYFVRVVDSLLVLNASINYIIYVMSSVSVKKSMCGNVKRMLCCVGTKVEVQNEDQSVNTLSSCDRNAYVQSENTKM